MEEVFNLHLFMGASSGFFISFYTIVFGVLHGEFSETLAVHTEDIEYTVNNKVIKKETWVVQEWSR